MNTSQKADLLKFCMEWPYKLSREFMATYCGFSSGDSLDSFAHNLGVSIDQRNKRSQWEVTKEFGITLEFMKEEGPRKGG